MCVCAYRGLDHVVSAEPHVTDKVEDIDNVLCLHLLQHGINCDECTSATHTRTEEEKGKREESIERKVRSEKEMRRGEEGEGEERR